MTARLVIAAVILLAVGVFAWFLRRRPSDPPQRDVYPVPKQLDRADFLERAPQLCTHALFPRGTNVQFARVIDAHTVQAWIWERGAGETLASGSSASAVCAAAVRHGLLQPGTFTVRMDGGDAEVEVTADYLVKLRGPAQMIYSGTLTAGMMSLVFGLPS